MKCRTNGFNATSYAFMSGTSMATPHVAGAAAFLFTKFPAATVAEVKNKILRSADRKASLTGRVATGARLNLYKAAAESTAAVSGGVLRFTAGAGQRNNVTATRFVDNGVPKYRITDPYSTSATTQQSGSRIKPGAGCTRVDDTTVKCPVAGITRIVLNGGDQDDTLNAGTIAIPVTLGGGAGMDTLTGGTAGDSLIGGTGADVLRRRRRQRHDQRPQPGRRHELQLRRERRRHRHRERRPRPERPGHRQPPPTARWSTSSRGRPPGSSPCDHDLPA